MYTSVGDDRLWYYPFISRKNCSFLSEKRFLWESSALGNRGWVDLEPDDPLVVVNFHALVQLRNHLRGQVQGGKSNRWENGVVPKWRLCCRGVCYSVLQCYSEEFAPERVVPSCWLPPEPRPGHCEGTWAFSFCFIKRGESFTVNDLPVQKSPDPSPEEGKGALFPEPGCSLGSRGEDDQQTIQWGKKRILALVEFPFVIQTEGIMLYPWVVRTDSRCIETFLRPSWAQ